MTNLLVAQHLNKTLATTPPRTLLHDINLTANAGEFLSIVGPSGSGKTTLLRCLSGLDSLTSGNVWLGQEALTTMKPAKLAKLRRTTVSFLFQQYNLLPALTVYDNLVLPLRLAKRPVDQNQLNQLLAQVHLTAKLNQYPNTLSDGEQQKVAIARALLVNTRLIFADEPTGALDAQSRQMVFNNLKALTTAGTCVVMVTHDLELAVQTDCAIVLKDGRITTIFDHPTMAQLVPALADHWEVASC